MKIGAPIIEIGVYVGWSLALCGISNNGGMIEVGPDGFLYIAMGDGDSGNDARAAF